MLITFTFALIIIILDQFTKYLTVTQLALHESQVVLPGWLNFTYVQNYGAGWGLMENQQVFFIIFTLLIVGVLVYRLWKYPQQKLFLKILYGIFLGGTLGNFIDRLRLGYVVDMIQVKFIDFPIFNVADMALSLSVFALIVYILLAEEEHLF